MDINNYDEVIEQAKTTASEEVLDLFNQSEELINKQTIKI